ncbi:MAG: hypothetical protein ACJAZ8_000863 [Planctomycetota bacterium]|jgi:hypothetical protein
MMGVRLAGLAQSECRRGSFNFRAGILMQVPIGFPIGL